MHASRGEQELAVGQQVRRVVASVEQLRRHYGDQHGLHPTDFRALLVLHARSRDAQLPTAGELAAELGLSSGAVTYLVERLVAADLLERVADPLDRRKVLLRPTRQGDKLVRDYLRPVQRGIDQLVQGMDTAQREALHTLLGGVDDLLLQLGGRPEATTD